MGVSQKYNKWRVKDFVNYFLLKKRQGLLKSATPISDFLVNEVASPSEAGIFFEAACFASLSLNLTSFGHVSMLKGNINITHDLTPYDSNKQVGDRMVKQGGQSGYSDIHFVKDGCLYITSVKFGVIYSIDDYDIMQLVSAATINEVEKQFSSVKYLVCCRDKNAFMKKLHASRTKNKLHAVNNVLDLNDIESAFGRLFDYNYSFEAYPEKRIPMTLEFHQDLLVRRMLQYQDDEPILCAMKCRSGKSHMIAAHIRARMALAEMNNDARKTFLILTPMPRETLCQFRDMFFKYIERNF